MIEELRTRLIKLLERNFLDEIIEVEETKSTFLNTDEDKPLSLRRSERLGLMVRSRLLLSEMYKEISLLKAYYITTQCLINFHYSCIGRIGNENGRLYNDEGFELPKELGDELRHLHEYKRDIKLKKPLEEPLKEIISDEMLMRIRATIEKEKQELPNSYLWIIIKHQQIDILFKQARYDEVVVFWDQAKTEWENLNDTYFKRMFDEYLVLWKALNGFIEDSIKMYKEVKAYADTYKHNDSSLIKFYGNMGEIVFNFNRSALWIQMFADARNILKEYLYKIGLNIDDMYTSINGLNQNTKMFKFSKQSIEQRNKQKPRYINLIGGIDIPEPETTKENKNFEDVFDFSNELFYELFYLDKVNELEKLKNSIYLSDIEILIKLDLRFWYALCVIEKKYDESIEVLK